MLDIGTGSGVLAIALAKRTHLPVMATDIDPVAVRIAAENARHQRCRSGGGGDYGRRAWITPVITRGRPYDLIVANILAGPLTKLAPSIAEVAEPGATIILSGILNRQAARVVSAYAQQGVALRRKLERGDWTTLILERYSQQRRR